jgi:HD domain-containing protein
MACSCSLLERNTSYLCQFGIVVDSKRDGVVGWHGRSSVKTDVSIVSWAAEQATSLLASLGDRWFHVQGVVETARCVGKMLSEEDRSYLIAAAYTHDIGYAPSLTKTGFHPLDGACYLRSLGYERLACLVAHHSEARFEAQLRGYAHELNAFPRERSATADALAYCDLTTGPRGEHISLKERACDIYLRYGETDIVTQAFRQAMPYASPARNKTLTLSTICSLKIPLSLVIAERLFQCS